MNLQEAVAALSHHSGASSIGNLDSFLGSLGASLAAPGETSQFVHNEDFDEMVEALDAEPVRIRIPTVLHNWLGFGPAVQ